MGEHRFNPVVKYLIENPGVRISSQEVKRMRKMAHDEAVAAYEEALSEKKTKKG